MIDQQSEKKYDMVITNYYTNKSCKCLIFLFLKLFIFDNLIFAHLFCIVSYILSYIAV